MSAAPRPACAMARAPYWLIPTLWPHPLPVRTTFGPGAEGTAATAGEGRAAPPSSRSPATSGTTRRCRAGMPDILLRAAPRVRWLAGSFSQPLQKGVEHLLGRRAAGVRRTGAQGLGVGEELVDDGRVVVRQ